MLYGKTKLVIGLVLGALILTAFAAWASDTRPVPEVVIEHVAEKTEAYELDLRIPKITGLEEINLKLQEAINQRVQDDIEAFQTELVKMAVEVQTTAEAQGWGDSPRYQMFTTVYLETISADLLSIVVDCYQYTGGAHGMTYKLAFNFDLTTGEELRLKDLFAQGTDYRSLLTGAVKNQISNPADYWDFDSIDPDQPYYLRDGQLVLYFGLYEIAPYAAGFPEFTIDRETLGTNYLY